MAWLPPRDAPWSVKSHGNGLLQAQLKYLSIDRSKQHSATRRHLPDMAALNLLSVSIALASPCCGRENAFREILRWAFQFPLDIFSKYHIAFIGRYDFGRFD